MMNKKILRPDRLRQVPAQFSWVDQRLVRENFLRYADPAAWSLYLVLVTVADAQGLSYYSEATLSRLLRMDPLQLARCRKRAYTGCVTSDLPQYVTRCLPGTSASDGGAYLQVHRLYVTRRHRPFRPAPDS